MSNSLRSKAPGGLVVSSASFLEDDPSFYTTITKGDWKLQVYPDAIVFVPIYHIPCYTEHSKFIMWWDKRYRKDYGQDPRCWKCGDKMPEDTADFLSKAWELYVL